MKVLITIICVFFIQNAYAGMNENGSKNLSAKRTSFQRKQQNNVFLNNIFNLETRAKNKLNQLKALEKYSDFKSVISDDKPGKLKINLEKKSHAKVISSDGNDRSVLSPYEMESKANTINIEYERNKLQEENDEEQGLESIN